MSDQFASYTSSSAFSVTMNGNGIQQLLELFEYERALIRMGIAPWQEGLAINQAPCRSYLLRRGLVQLVPSNGRWVGQRYMLTRPGLWLAMLLKEAKHEYIGPRSYKDQAYMRWLCDQKKAKPSKRVVSFLLANWGVPSNELSEDPSLEDVARMTPESWFE